MLFCDGSKLGLCVYELLVLFALWTWLIRCLATFLESKVLAGTLGKAARCSSSSLARRAVRETTSTCSVPSTKVMLSNSLRSFSHFAALSLAIAGSGVPSLEFEAGSGAVPASLAPVQTGFGALAGVAAAAAAPMPLANLCPHDACAMYVDFITWVSYSQHA